MKAIKSYDYDTIEHLVDALEKEREDINSFIADLNDAVSNAVDQTTNDAGNNIFEQIALYNEKLNELNEMLSENQAKMEVYSEHRSEKWHDSDAGMLYEEWKSDWDEFYDNACGMSIEEPEYPELEELPSDYCDISLEVLPQNAPEQAG